MNNLCISAKTERNEHTFEQHMTEIYNGNPIRTIRQSGSRHPLSSPSPRRHRSPWCGRWYAQEVCSSCRCLSRLSASWWQRCGGAHAQSFLCLRPNSRLSHRRCEVTTTSLRFSNFCPTFLKKFDSKTKNRATAGKNPAFKTFYIKIGYTTNINDRLRELYNTSVPLPFKVYALLKTNKYRV